MQVKIHPSWLEPLKEQWDAPYFESLTKEVRRRYAVAQVFPPPARIFAAFDECPFDNIKVVIIGQDPYHGPGQANGLCFSVAPGVAMPPSLVNIFKEICADTGGSMPTCGDLSYLAAQGVLLLNATLTVEAHRPASHQGLGWETFTDAVIRAVNERLDGVVFLLWGSYAIRKGAIIDRERHLVLTSPHPSPLSAHRGFFGNHHFSRANEYLRSRGKAPVKWL
ncbi:MAG: uracil-DNA glycosylase [Muribaculaceae bacterium]|nr:uracil-DNA glycosylase [Muribaculaceae bacterium]